MPARSTTTCSLETLNEARDNASFATSDEYLGLAEPDGVDVPTLDLFREDLAGFSTDRKVELAAELERAVRAADPRITGVEAADYSDAIVDGCVVTNTGIRTTSRETSCYLSTSCVATEGDDTQTGFGFSVGREPADLDVSVAAADAARRATRLLGATQPGERAVHGRARSVRDRAVPRHHRLDAVGRGRPEGPLAVRRPAGRGGRRLGDHAGRRPDESRRVHRVGHRRRGPGQPAQPADRRGCAPPVRAEQLHRPSLRNRLDRQCGPRVQVDSTVGCRALSLAPGTKDQPALLADVGNGVLVSSVSGLHSGVNPVSGDFSTGAEGLRISGGALGEPLREFTIASTLQRMLQDVAAVGSDIEWLPMSAAGVSVVIRDVTVSGA